ncbi:MAG: hypothetical protein E7D69_13655 [Clostridium celatum]|nr:hypothetical protein [Clostridium celatum]UVX34333.1 MAG: hypothetical protein [Bacteriophage sp.]
MYKCENCRVQREVGDDVYLVESAFMERFLPTCSKKCCEIIKEREVNKVQTVLDRMKNTEIKKERW